jgi:selenocysteine lyase/cysteine desulfurase
METLLAQGVKLATPADPGRRGATVAIRAADDAALVERLAARGIVTSCRDGNVRASFHFYNDSTDIARLVAALAAERSLLA